MILRVFFKTQPKTGFQERERDREKEREREREREKKYSLNNDKKVW